MKKMNKRALISIRGKVDGRGLTDESEYGKLQHSMQREGALTGNWGSSRFSRKDRRQA